MKHPKSYDSDPETRKRMSRVKLKNGAAEQLLAKRLWHMGLRYRKNDRRLPGSPDIAITKYKIAIFVDGEFWHGKDWEVRKERLRRNREYWIEKIQENMARDERNAVQLERMGWRVLRFWEKDVKRDPDACVGEVGDAVLEHLCASLEAEDRILTGNREKSTLFGG